MRTIAMAVAAMCICGPAAAMTLSSVDFKDGGVLPAQHVYPRCGGQNVSPQLSWSGVPQGTGELVLTMIDVSVKPNGWSHWIVGGIPTTATTLDRGLKTLPPPAKAVASNFGDAFYDGPCPPPGTGLHRYEFTLWAIAPNTAVPLTPGMTGNDVITLMTRLTKDHATIAATVSAR